MNPHAFLQGRTRETSIRRNDRGQWFFDGDPLTHPNLVRSFDRWIGKAEDGRYCLRNDINWAYITLEGPPYFVRAVRTEGETVTLLLSNGTQCELRPATLRQDAAGALYCQAPDELWARFDNAAVAQLEDLVEEDGEGPYLRIAGQVVHPPQFDEAPF